MMKQVPHDVFIKLLSSVSEQQLMQILRDGEISPNEAREADDLRSRTGRKRFVVLPPPDHGVEWRGPVKWPWFSARRRGHLLEQQVGDLSARVAHLEQHLMSDLMRRAKEKA